MRPGPWRLGGMPRIRGIRIPVATVIGMLADGITQEEILKALPNLVREDIREVCSMPQKPCVGVNCH